MFRLEKVFQNDDKVFIYFVNLVKSFIIFLTFYIFIVLKKHTIYDLTNINILKNSIYFDFLIIFSTVFFIFPTFVKNYTY